MSESSDESSSVSTPSTTTTTESSSTSSSSDEEDDKKGVDSKKRVTRKEAKLRGKQRQPGGRMLRSREKPPKIEEKKVEHKCQFCKKTFQTVASVNRHSRWCTKSKKSKKAEKSDSNSKTPIKSERKVGRPSKKKLFEEENEKSKKVRDKEEVVVKKKARKEVDETESKKTVKKLILKSQSPISTTNTDTATAKNKKISESEDTITTNNNNNNNNSYSSFSFYIDNDKKEESTDEKTKIDTDHSFTSIPTTTPTKIQINNEKNIEENPVTCQVCKLTYRNPNSYAKHLPNCAPCSSDEEEDDDDDSENDVDDNEKGEKKVKVKEEHPSRHSSHYEETVQENSNSSSLIIIEKSPIKTERTEPASVIIEPDEETSASEASNLVIDEGEKTEDSLLKIENNTSQGQKVVAARESNNKITNSHLKIESTFNLPQQLSKDITLLPLNPNNNNNQQQEQQQQQSVQEIQEQIQPNANPPLTMLQQALNGSRKVSITTTTTIEQNPELNFSNNMNENEQIKTNGTKEQLQVQFLIQNKDFSIQPARKIINNQPSPTLVQQIPTNSILNTYNNNSQPQDRFVVNNNNNINQQNLLNSSSTENINFQNQSQLAQEINSRIINLPIQSASAVNSSASNSILTNNVKTEASKVNGSLQQQLQQLPSFSANGIQSSLTNNHLLQQQQQQQISNFSNNYNNSSLLQFANSEISNSYETSPTTIKENSQQSPSMQILPQSQISYQTITVQNANGQLINVQMPINPSHLQPPQNQQQQQNFQTNEQQQQYMSMQQQLQQQQQFQQQIQFYQQQQEQQLAIEFQKQKILQQQQQQQENFTGISQFQSHQLSQQYQQQQQQQQQQNLLSTFQQQQQQQNLISSLSLQQQMEIISQQQQQQQQPSQQHSSPYFQQQQSSNLNQQQQMLQDINQLQQNQFLIQQQEQQQQQQQILRKTTENNMGNGNSNNNITYIMVQQGNNITTVPVNTSDLVHLGSQMSQLQSPQPQQQANSSSFSPSSSIIFQQQDVNSSSSPKIQQQQAQTHQVGDLIQNNLINASQSQLLEINQQQQQCTANLSQQQQQQQTAPIIHLHQHQHQHRPQLNLSGISQTKPCPCDRCLEKVIIAPSPSIQTERIRLITSITNSPPPPPASSSPTGGLKKLLNGQQQPQARQFTLAPWSAPHPPQILNTQLITGKRLTTRAPIRAPQQIAMANNNNHLLTYRPQTQLQKILPATTVATTPIVNSISTVPRVSTTPPKIISSILTTIPVDLQQLSPEPTLVLHSPGKPSSLSTSTNIAVVRPMEHPLQKLSEQLSQIENTFNNNANANNNTSTTSATSATTNNILRLPLPPPPINSVQEQVPSILNVNLNNNAIISTATAPTIPPVIITTTTTSNTANNNKKESPAPANTTTAPENTTLENSNKNSIVNSPKLVQVQVNERVNISPNTNTNDSQQQQNIVNKSIKVTLKRKEGDDAYSIKNISQSGEDKPGAMRSLKIKAKITSGENAGKSTDVVVKPVLQSVPLTNDEIAASTSANGDTKMVHRAIILYEVKCDGELQFRSSDVRAVWSYIFETVQGTKLNHNLPPLTFENKQDVAENSPLMSDAGVIHKAVQFLIEQLACVKEMAEKKSLEKASSSSSTPKPSSSSAAAAGRKKEEEKEENLKEKMEVEEEEDEEEDKSIRTEGNYTRKPFNMFSWVTSKHREPPSTIASPNPENINAGLRFRPLREKAEKYLYLHKSEIHGMGLFIKKDFEQGEIVIQYAGELIRSIISDRREKLYESKGIGCFFFKFDDLEVIDATMKGNCARFINHSCEPNAESKCLKILGKKRIVIIALRKIFAGEELTYDYKFKYEDDNKKIPCTCGSIKCQKFLN